MSPRELALVMKAENERRLDSFEVMSVHALMIRKANLTKPKKRLKPDDFFKRPVDYEKFDKEIANYKEKQDEQKKWIQQFTFQPKPKGGSDSQWQKKN